MLTHDSMARSYKYFMMYILLIKYNLTYVINCNNNLVVLKSHQNKCPKIKFNNQSNNIIQI